jgi:hypothetical protein
LTDYQFSLFHERDGIGRIEYASFDDDAAALRHATSLVADFDKVPVLDRDRIVGVELHARHKVRAPQS